MIGLCGALWGLVGVIMLLGFSVVRLTGMVIDMWAYDLQWHHWVALGISVVAMAYMEGYRGFQYAFAPRVAARAKHLVEHPHLLHVLAAPLFCMGYFHIQRRRQIAIFSLTTGIILLIAVVRLLPQPWRGIVDAGVVVGLTWGLVSVVVWGLRALLSDTFPYTPEVPESEAVTQELR